jgi:formylglycine-generating enzyme required for sulfatase activity
MGCNPEVDLVEDQTCEGEVFLAQPYRQVELSTYWIDQTEVTWAAYDACVEADVCPTIESACGPREDDEPVCTVKWSSAELYCQWAGKRLPTEGVGEKAARGVDGRRYPWGNDELACEYAEHNVQLPGDPCNSNNGPEAVGSFPAGTSPYGALDMAGNIMEWVHDGYVEGEGYQGLPETDPVREGDLLKIARGGAYSSFGISALGYGLRVSQRQAHVPEAEGPYFLGFRCARSGS